MQKLIRPTATILALTVLTSSLLACGSPITAAPTAVPPPLDTMVGKFVPVGEPEIKPLPPINEVVNNCGPGGVTMYKQPSVVVSRGEGLTWEIGGTTGVGVKIGQGIIPGGVDLSASLQGRYSNELNQSVQTGVNLQLGAAPGEVVVYTLVWKEVWQHGYVDVTLADHTLKRINVSYRDRMLVESVNKQVERCEGSQTASGAPPPVPQTQTAPSSVPIATSSAANTPSSSGPVSPSGSSQPSTSGPWRVNEGGIPSRDGSSTWDVRQGEVLILTGGKVRYQDFDCQDDASQVCVIIVEATRNQSITVGNLMAGQNWLGISPVFKAEQALADVRPLFWRGPNCGSGCARANIAIYRDGQLQVKRTEGPSGVIPPQPPPNTPWRVNQGGIPARDGTATWDLNPGEVLILTGGRVRYKNFDCRDDSTQQCVVIVESTRKQSITFENLLAGQNWVGISQVFSADEALGDVKPLFWRAPNCGGGCQKANIAIFRDDQVKATRIERP